MKSKQLTQNEDIYFSLWRSCYIISTYSKFLQKESDSSSKTQCHLIVIKIIVLNSWTDNTCTIKINGEIDFL